MSPPRHNPRPTQPPPTDITETLRPCPCGLTNEEYTNLCNKVDQMSQDIADIRTAVIGHEQYGHRGLIARMTIVERTLFILSLVAVALGGERVIKFLF